MNIISDLNSLRLELSNRKIHGWVEETYIHIPCASDRTYICVGTDDYDERYEVSVIKTDTNKLLLGNVPFKDLDELARFVSHLAKL